jgi:hypothetical protein
MDDRQLFCSKKSIYKALQLGQAFENGIGIGVHGTPRNVEIHWRVRRAVLVEGRSQRAVAREFGISRKTIQKMLRYAVPPGYQR